MAKLKLEDMLLEDALALAEALMALYRDGHRLLIVTAQGEHIDPLED